MSLFNRPAWSQAQAASVNESEANIFSHSSRSYQSIIADSERRKKEKQERRTAKEERRISDKQRARNEQDAEGSNKKRRITLEDGEALLSSVGLNPPPLSRQEQGTSETAYEDGPVRRSPRTNRHAKPEYVPAAKNHDRSTQVIELGDSDDGENETSYAAPPPEPEKIDEESDDEFADLARRARQLRQETEQLGKKSRTPDTTALPPSPGIGLVTDTGQRSVPTPPPDPTIEIFVHSRIPNANPLIVHRKLSQNTQEIRRVWCQKQGFSEGFTKGVFFIHRMRRVYDVTTCRSLGLEVDAFGNVTMKGAEGMEGGVKVHLEAVTDEIFEAIKAEKAREAKKRSGELPHEESADAGATGDDGALQQPKEESLIRLLLKAKGKEDFKLKVKRVSRPVESPLTYRPLIDTSLEHALLQDHRCIQEDAPFAIRPIGIPGVRWRTSRS